MNIITPIISAALPLVNLFLLFRIWKELQKISADAENREQLKADIKRFGTMFAAAADVPRPRKAKVEKEDDTE